VNLSSYIDKLSSLFVEVGRSAPRYQEIALLYPRSTKLQSYPTEFFIVVVNLCRYPLKFGQMSTVQQFTSSLSDALLKTFQTDGSRREGEVDQRADRCKRSPRELWVQVFDQRHAIKIRVLDFALHTIMRQRGSRLGRRATHCSTFNKPSIAS
jgi:hypothetical protein